tara:strand:- start:248 stop:2584 length:2337 start_codon:yes stop_codon:yes gene_type:complete
MMTVGLYIKNKRFVDLTNVTINNFQKRIESDGGVFEARECLKNQLDALGGSFGDSIVYDRFDLFNDEKISVTSSIQNINDISKTFTDYSNSFTIPASDVNNEILKHWYENDLNNGFDQRVRYDGYIEIDTNIFRVGKWQLESASIKDNRIENYKLVFYGNLKSLTDLFAEDKLKDITELNVYTVEYSGEQVQGLVETTNSERDIYFPLISSNRIWQNQSPDINNITVTAGAIHYDELFPAIRLQKVFDSISSKYGVTFSGDFLSQSRFYDAFLWLKNNESPTFNVLAEKQRIDFTLNKTSSFFQINRDTDTVTASSFPSGGQSGFDATFSLFLTFPSPIEYFLTINKNGAIYTTLTGTGTNIDFSIEQFTGVGAYTFDIQSSVASTYTYTYTAEYWDYNNSTNDYTVLFSGNGSGSINNNIDLTSFCPDMKVTDFVSGVLKMFNLTAFSENGIDFTLEQLENWYFKGGIKDFSEYSISDFDFERIKPYKKIKFKYEKSESVLNTNFYDVNSRYYGDLEYTFNNDGSDYTLQLPFENILFSRFTSSNIQVAYCVKPDLTPYKPKPIILYKYSNTNTSFYFDNGTTVDLIENYNIFGQDCIFENTDNSLNFGVEISSYVLQPLNNSLFNNYYLSYLSNLYSLKSRMLKVKMILPYNEIIDLKLNDRIVLRGKRYIINQYTTDLTTFETSFELIQDFRTISFNNSKLNTTTGGANTLKIYTTSKSPLTWTLDTDADGMIDVITSGNDFVSVDVFENNRGFTKTSSIISNENDIIIIRQTTI